MSRGLWGQDLDPLRRAQALKLARFETVLPMLGPAPGMRILDVGAGLGLQSVRMATLVGPSGGVCAADVDAAMVERARAEAAAAGASNVEALVMAGDGTPPEDRRGRYDAALLYDVVVYLEDLAGYFRRLGGWLKPGAAVVVVSSVGPCRVEEEDVRDWDAWGRAVAALPPADPFAALAAPDRGGLVKSANAILDGALFDRCRRGEGFPAESGLTPGEDVYARWALLRLLSSGTPAREPGLWKPVERQLAQALNKLLLVARWRRHFTEGLPRPYLSGALERGRVLQRIPAAAAEAGYALERWTELPPFQRAYLFRGP